MTADFKHVIAKFMFSMSQSGYGALNFKSIPEKTNAALKTVSRIDLL